jgi:iron complex transport system ATP-binding protein
MKLRAEGLTLGYGRRPIVHEVSLEVPSGQFCVIVGPNASGKSTLLRGLGRVMRPISGTVWLDDEDIFRIDSGEVARSLAVLPQMQQFDVDLVVEELVWRGRTPHQHLLRAATVEDAHAVERALEAAGLLHLRDRPLRALSGGERQRAWLALALAQEPRVLLLDEPTTFLDLRHQIEVMEVLTRLNEGGMTVVAVLHDLGLASRYAHRVVALQTGRVVLDGTPEEVLRADALGEVFGLQLIALTDPRTGRPLPFPA